MEKYILTARVPTQQYVYLPFPATLADKPMTIKIIIFDPPIELGSICDHQEFSY